MNKDHIKSYYSSGIEIDRLQLAYFKLEGIRTKEIISRYLNNKKTNIIDIGGGAGYYAFWLSSLGHDVTLVDLSADNIAWAKDYAVQNNVSLHAYETGDATSLSFPDNLFDLGLLLGPLYHLQDRTDRVAALKEAARVLKPGGILISAVISRYASLIDGLRRNLIADPQFVNILKQDLETGIHMNPTDNPQYFTHSFFHTPDEIENEIKDSHLIFEKCIAVESLGWLQDDVMKTADPSHIDLVLDLIRKVETNPDLMASSPHIIAIARKT